MRLSVDNSFSQAVNQQITDAFAVSPRAYMDTGVSTAIQAPASKKDRFQKCLQVIEELPVQPANAADVVQLFNSVILAEERAYWGDNYPRADRMYPLAMLGTRSVDHHPDTAALISAKQAILIGPNGAFQVWSRDDQHNGPALELTEKIMDKPGADHQRLDIKG